LSDPAVRIRQGLAEDLPAIGRIQAASPEASQWNVREYLEYDLRVAAISSQIAGFAVTRQVAEGESELLNLAVDPAFRRLGVARSLLTNVMARHPGNLWLEVRESHAAARNLYKKLGFCEVAIRQDYYSDSHESAIVMKVHS